MRLSQQNTHTHKHKRRIIVLHITHLSVIIILCAVETQIMQYMLVVFHSSTTPQLLCVRWQPGLWLQHNIRHIRISIIFFCAGAECICSAPRKAHTRGAWRGRGMRTTSSSLFVRPHPPSKTVRRRRQRESERERETKDVFGAQSQRHRPIE